eukprot:746239-Hanusia_phi.AAC.10
MSRTRGSTFTIARDEPPQLKTNIKKFAIIELHVNDLHSRARNCQCRGAGRDLPWISRSR